MDGEGEQVVFLGKYWESLLDSPGIRTPSTLIQLKEYIDLQMFATRFKMEITSRWSFYKKMAKESEQLKKMATSSGDGNLFPWRRPMPSGKTYNG